MNPAAALCLTHLLAFACSTVVVLSYAKRGLPSPWFREFFSYAVAVLATKHKIYRRNQPPITKPQAGRPALRPEVVTSLSAWRLATTVGAHLIDVIHLVRLATSMGILSAMQPPPRASKRAVASQTLDIVLTAFSVCIFSTLGMAVNHKLESGRARGGR